MGVILSFPKHVLMGTRMAPCNCARRDVVPGACMICDGGLSACVVCNGAEGSMPTDCPGFQMEPVVEEDVYAGVIDYDAREGWVQRDAAAEQIRRARHER